MTLSVIIQAKDPVGNLALTVFDIHTFLESKKIGHEIILLETSDQSIALQELNQRLIKSAPELQIYKVKEEANASPLSQAVSIAKNEWILCASQTGFIEVVELEKILESLDKKTAYVSNCEHNKEKTSFLGINNKVPEHQLILATREALATLPSDITKEELVKNLAQKEEFQVNCTG
ncbi:MAG: hypothetical protein R3B52_02440 [Candidatus Paceibacterota bacterium]